MSETQLQRIAGPMTFDTYSAIREQTSRWPLDRDIVVDLSGVTELDSSALALIFHWRRRARQHHVVLLELPDSLMALADLYGVVDILTESPT